MKLALQNLLWLFFSLSCLFFSALNAAEKPVCHENDFFHVSVLEHIESPGSDFIIHKKTIGEQAPACNFKASPKDIKFPPSHPYDRAYYFEKLYQRMMLLDSGTGTQRTLSILDLTSMKIIFNHIYFQDLRYDGNNVYFFGAGSKGTVKDCPKLTSELVQEGGQIEPEFVLNLKTMTLKKTGKIDCNYEDSPAWTN